jgi:hypothetical protein
MNNKEYAEKLRKNGVSEDQIQAYFEDVDRAVRRHWIKQKIENKIENFLAFIVIPLVVLFAFYTLFKCWL